MELLTGNFESSPAACRLGVLPPPPQVLRIISALLLVMLHQLDESQFYMKWRWRKSCKSCIQKKTHGRGERQYSSAPLGKLNFTTEGESTLPWVRLVLNSTSLLPLPIGPELEAWSLKFEELTSDPETRSMNFFFPCCDQLRFKDWGWQRYLALYTPCDIKRPA